MKTFVPNRDFYGFPDGKTMVLFRAGVETFPLADEFVDLMVTKGHVAQPPKRVNQLPPPSIAVAKKFAAATKSPAPARRRGSRKG